MELLHYRTYGEGPAIVLLHGFCESASIFKHFLPSLTAHGRVITIDLGGFGQSAGRLPRPVTMDSMAQQVAAVLDHLSIEKAVFIWHLPTFIPQGLEAYVCFILQPLPTAKRKNAHATR